MSEKCQKRQRRGGYQVRKETSCRDLATIYLSCIPALQLRKYETYARAYLSSRGSIKDHVAQVQSVDAGC